MKINLIFYLSEFGIGGAGNSIYKLCKNLPSKKYNISIICLNTCFYKKRFKALKVKVYEIKTTRSILAIKTLKKIVNSKISSNFKSNIFISNIHYSNIISILFLGIPSLKIVLIERTPFEELSIYYGLIDFIKKNIIKLLINFTFKKADMCISNSNYISKRYNEKYSLNFKTIFPPSFNGKIYLNNNLINKKSQKLKIITVCRLSKEKNLNRLINLISELGNKFYLYIIGKGPDYNNLRELVINLNKQKNIIFLGQHEPERVKKLIKKFDIFINSSDFEGFPNSVVEALSVGVPVLASQSYGGINEILKNKNYGLIYKNENELKKLLVSYNKDEIKFVFDKSKLLKHLNNFSEKNNLKNYEKVFLKLSK